MRKVYDGNNFVYHVGGRTALGIQRPSAEYADERFVQNRVGLHHLCLRARSREDVDAAAAKLRGMGARIDRGPVEGDWAPGYYYIVFEDPDGIRLEINHVPGKGPARRRHPDFTQRRPGLGPESLKCVQTRDRGEPPPGLPRKRGRRVPSPLPPGGAGGGLRPLYRSAPNPILRPP